MTDSARPASFRIRRGGKSVVLEIAGELDISTGAQLHGELARAQARDARLVVDLRRVTFMDCSSLGKLVAARAHARRVGGRFVVILGGARLDPLFRLTRLPIARSMLEAQIAIA
jgi:anti-sigma B factor antagonist